MITAVETRAVVTVQRREGNCYKIQVVQESLVDKVTFEQRPEGNAGASLHYLGEEHCWQRECQVWKPWNSVVLDLCEEEVEIYASGVGWTRNSIVKEQVRNLMETLVFTVGQVTTGRQRQETMIFFFLPHVLKRLLSLLDEKSMIRGQEWTRLLLQKSRQELMMIVLEGDEKWLGCILKAECRVNHIWKFSPHRWYIQMLKLAEITSRGSLGRERNVFMGGSLGSSDLERLKRQEGSTNESKKE